MTAVILHLFRYKVQGTPILNMHFEHQLSSEPISLAGGSILAAVAVCLLFPLSVGSSGMQTSAYVTVLSQSTILVSKLRDIKMSSSQGMGVTCMAQCASVTPCVYVTADTISLTCSLYIVGCSLINVVGLFAYEVKHSS